MPQTKGKGLSGPLPETRIEFRLIELPKGAEYRYAVVSFRVEKLTGRALGYAWLFHARGGRVCPPRVLFVCLGPKKEKQQMSIEVANALYHDKLCPILEIVLKEHEEISERYFAEYTQTRGFSLEQYITEQERLSGTLRNHPADIASARGGVRLDPASAILAGRDFESYLRSPHCAYATGLYPGGLKRPQPVRYDSVAYKRLSNFEVKWQDKRLWNFLLGPPPDQTPLMLWKFNYRPSPGKREDAHNQLAKMILRKFWEQGFEPQWGHSNYSALREFRGRKLISLPFSEIAEILRLETGHDFRPRNVEIFRSELKLKKVRGGGAQWPESQSSPIKNRN